MNYMLGQRSLWVFDFDGTLSPIVPERNEARLHRECERMLRFLARSPWNRVAVLSSRTLDDVVSRVPVPGVFVGGASGLDLRELRERIAVCGENVLFHHFCETTLRGTFDNPDYRNDFAVWSKLYLGDRVLAERLGILDPYASLPSRSSAASGFSQDGQRAPEDGEERRMAEGVGFDRLRLRRRRLRPLRPARPPDALQYVALFFLFVSGGLAFESHRDGVVNRPPSLLAKTRTPALRSCGVAPFFA